MEYELQDEQEPHLFVICRQLRTAPRAVVKQAVYYILDGSVYQAPSLHAALSSRIVRPPSRTAPAEVQRSRATLSNHLWPAASVYLHWRSVQAVCAGAA
jgi:hypothetical protein